MRTRRAPLGQPEGDAQRAGTDERQVRDELLPALAAVCAAAGLDYRGATLLRYVRNAVFQLARHPVVVRIALAPPVRERVAKMVAVARWLAAHGMPAVRLLDGVDQPLVAGGHIATFWRYEPPVGAAPTGGDLARLLRRLHVLAPPDEPLPEWDPLVTVRAAVEHAAGIAEADREFLRRSCLAVQERLVGLSYELPPGPIHGDAWLGNVLPARAGPVLCDFDSACVGPREWDLTPMAVGRLRLGVPARVYREFATGYGFDVMRLPGFEVLRQVRELKRVTGALPILDGNPQARAEFVHRLRTLRSGRRGARWRPYQ